MYPFKDYSIVTHDNYILNVVASKNFDPAKECVIFIHGIGGDSMTWMPFTLPFVGKYNIIIPDLRGFGKSHKIRYKSHVHAGRDIATIIEHFVPEGRQCKLCSLSMGAVVSYYYFREFGHQNRISHFMNVDQTPVVIPQDGHLGIFGEDHEKNWSAMLRCVDEYRNFFGTPIEETPRYLQQEFKELLVMFFSYAFHRKHEKMVIKTFLHPDNPSSSAFFKKIRANNFRNYVDIFDNYRIVENLSDSLNSSETRLTQIIGSYSEMFPASSQILLAENSKNVDSVVHFNESHALMWTAPKQFMQELKIFLER